MLHVYLRAGRKSKPLSGLKRILVSLFEELMSNDATYVKTA